MLLRRRRGCILALLRLLLVGHLCHDRHNTLSGFENAILLKRRRHNKNQRLTASMNNNNGIDRRPLLSKVSVTDADEEATETAAAAAEAAAAAATVAVTASDVGDACEIGLNAVERCKAVRATESKASAVSNLSKCICGAGSFALPHVFLKEGVLGGILAMTVCGGLAAYTMKSLSQSKREMSSPPAPQQVAASSSNTNAAAQSSSPPPPPSSPTSTSSETTTASTTTSTSATITSYVELAESAIGRRAGQVVFFLTLCASLGVCSTYIAFVGQTLESLSSDASSHNYVRQLLPDVPRATWEAGIAAFALVPLSSIRDYSIFAFTSALGVFCVVGGILVTLASGIFVNPGWDAALQGLSHVPLWPESLAVAFGGSFGTIAYLFCINFLTFPIMNSMKQPQQYGSAVYTAVSGVWLVNVVFAVLCLGFYGKDTQDLVLANLDNGPYLSALKLLLCVDLLFTFPIVFSSGRQILENALIGADKVDDSPWERTALVACAVAACFGLAQIGGFGAVANLVGGVAQGTLAFIMPPAIAVAIASQQKKEDDGLGRDSSRMQMLLADEIVQWLIGAFGVVVVSAVSYSTAVDMMHK